MSESDSWSTSTPVLIARSQHRARRLNRRGPNRDADTPRIWALTSPEVGPLLAVVGAVVLGNALLLLGVFNPNPINVVSGLGVVVHSGVLPGTYSIDPNNGFTAQALGHLAALDLLHGHLPWWNPFEGVGAPLAGEMQAAALFPGTLVLAFANGQLFFHVLLELVTGIATYRLLLRLDISRWICAICGGAFALNGTFSWFEHAPVNPIAFLPLLLLGVERARTAAETHRGHRWGLIAVALALSLYAGFPEVAYLDGIVAVGWALARAQGLHRRELLEYSKKIAFGAAAGALIAAPILVAFADYVPSANLGAHASGLNNAFLPHASAASLLFPYSYGPIFGFLSFDKTGLLNLTWGNVGGYLTTSILVLGAVGLYARRLRPLRIVLALWIVLSVGRTYGIQPFARLFALFPLMDKVAAYRYAPPSWELAAIALAALGLDDIRRRTVPTWYMITALAGAVAVAIRVFLTGDVLRAALASAPHIHAWIVASGAWGFGMILVVGLAMLTLRGRARTVILLVCLMLDTTAMFVVPELSAPRHASIDTGPVVWLQRHLGDQRFYTLGPIAPDYGSYFGLAEVNVNDVPIPKLYGRYVTHALDPNVNPLVFTGASQLDPSGPDTLQEFLSHLAGYEAIGVAYLVTDHDQVPSATASRGQLRRVYADSVADIYRLPKTETMYAVRSGACRLTDETLSGVVADCRTRAVVVRRELYVPGWSAGADGRSLAVGRSDGLFQSVVLEPGRSVVTFSFLPGHERAALAALLVGLALLAGECWLGNRRRGRRRVGLRPDPTPEDDPPPAS